MSSVPRLDRTISRRRFLEGSAATAMASLAFPRLEPASAAPQDRRALTAGDSWPPSGPVDEAFWRTVRKQFNIVDDMVFMQNGTLGPMPRPVLEANIAYLRAIGEDPRNPIGNQMEGVRAKVAAFVGADPEEIVLTRSTTEGVKIFAQGLRLKAGDEVLFSTLDHPETIDVYRMLEELDGIRIEVVNLPLVIESADQVLSLYEKAITPRTRAIIGTHVVYINGTVMPVKALAELAHRRGLLFSVDGAHGPGQLDVDVHDLGVDHYAASGQKWLMAGTGTGICYVKRDVQPKIAGDIYVDPAMAATARKYERSGQRNIPTALGMGTAVDFHTAIGKKNIETRDRELSARVKAGLKDLPGVKLLSPMKPELSGGVTAFSIGEIPSANIARAVLELEGIQIVRLPYPVPYYRTPGPVLNAARVSNHIYNSPAEVDRLLSALRRIAENASKYMTA